MTGTTGRENAWARDRTAGWLGVGFLVLLLGSEAALTLPDADASADSVADFYSRHVGVIVTLQVVGFLACLLLGLFAWRLRDDDRRVAAAGILLAVLAATPGILTVALALVADPADPSQAGSLNDLLPRGDDLLFVGVLLFAATVAAAGHAVPVWLRVLAGLVLALVAVRLLLEVAGASTGVWESLAPIAFLLLVAGLVVLVFRGSTARSATPAG
jgi:hypothetical protein